MGQNGWFAHTWGDTLMTGEYQHSLDSKGRLFMPAKLRDELGEVFFITISMDRCLCAYSAESWKNLSDRVNAMPYVKQRKMRPLFAHAARCELDAQGRTLIPQNLREYAGFVKNVTVVGCWFGASENLGPQLVPVGHHGRVPACVGFAFVGNVVVDPLYAALHLPDFTDVTIAGNTFIATNKVPHLAKDEAIVSIYHDRPKGPGSPTVRLSGNRYVLDPVAPRRKLYVSPPRKRDVVVEDEQ